MIAPVGVEPPCEDCTFWKALLCRRCLKERRPDLFPKREPFTPHPRSARYRGGHAEQIGRYGSPNGRKFEKKRASRLRRRAERLDPENAPTRLIRGWND